MKLLNHILLDFWTIFQFRYRVFVIEQFMLKINKLINKYIHTTIKFSDLECFILF